MVPREKQEKFTLIHLLRLSSTSDFFEWMVEQSSVTEMKKAAGYCLPVYTKPPRLELDLPPSVGRSRGLTVSGSVQSRGHSGHDVSRTQSRLNCPSTQFIGAAIKYMLTT